MGRYNRHIIGANRARVSMFAYRNWELRPVPGDESDAGPSGDGPARIDCWPRAGAIRISSSPTRRDTAVPGDRVGVPGAAVTDVRQVRSGLGELGILSSHDLLASHTQLRVLIYPPSFVTFPLTFYFPFLSLVYPCTPLIIHP